MLKWSVKHNSTSNFEHDILESPNHYSATCETDKRPKKNGHDITYTSSVGVYLPENSPMAGEEQTLCHKIDFTSPAKPLPSLEQIDSEFDKRPKPLKRTSKLSNLGSNEQTRVSPSSSAYPLTGDTFKTWDEISFIQEDGQTKPEDLHLRVFSSYEDTSSSSGISTGGSDLEWKSFDIPSSRSCSFKVKVKSEAEHNGSIRIESETSVRNCSCGKDDVDTSTKKKDSAANTEVDTSEKNTEEEHKQEDEGLEKEFLRWLTTLSAKKGSEDGFSSFFDNEETSEKFKSINGDSFRKITSPSQVKLCESTSTSFNNENGKFVASKIKQRDEDHAGRSSTLGRLSNKRSARILEDVARNSNQPSSSWPRRNTKNSKLSKSCAKFNKEIQEFTDLKLESEALPKSISGNVAHDSKCNKRVIWASEANRNHEKGTSENSGAKILHQADAATTPATTKPTEMKEDHKKLSFIARIIPTLRRDKTPKRQSHFFTDEDPSDNLPYSRSWLDENILEKLSDSEKAENLSRSRSFSFPKGETILIFGRGGDGPNFSKITENPQLKKALEKLSNLKGISKSLPKPKNRIRPHVTGIFAPFKGDTDRDKNTNKGGIDAVLNIAESRDYLMWCPDNEFDQAVSFLDMRGLVELIQTLQDAMAVEQQTFESLSLQLEQIRDPLLQQRLSAALCTSQTRLARLCARNMRCFAQQAMKSRHKQGSHPLSLQDSRSSSPRDSGLAVSSTTGSDFDCDFGGLSPTPGISSSLTLNTTSFKNSLNFFQKAAANFAAQHSKAIKGHRHKSASKSSSAVDSQPEQTPLSSTIKSRNGELLNGVDCLRPTKDTEEVDDEFGEVNGALDSKSSLSARLEDDQETYEQVLFINGKPLYPGDSSLRSQSCERDAPESDFKSLSSCNLVRNERTSRNSFPSSDERSRSCSWARLKDHCNGTSPAGSPLSAAPGTTTAATDTPVERLSGQCVVSAAPSLNGVSDKAFLARLTEGNCDLALPRRKPFLNFGSVQRQSVDDSGFCGNSGVIVGYSDSECQVRNCNSLSRAHSFKEGLDQSSESISEGGSLSRAQSYIDGLADDFNESVSSIPKLKRVPSIDEILDSVKSLRAKRNMVRSDPDLLLSQEKSSKHKSSKKKSSSKSVGNGSIKSYHEYEQIREDDSPQHFYENIPSRKNEEHIYDSPKSPERYYEQNNNSGEHYENIPYEPPLYENLKTEEPTYMNVTNKSKKSSGKKSSKQQPDSYCNNTYANIEETLHKSSSKKQSKTDVQLDNQTYDVPKSATHIYDIPPKQTRKVKQHENEYDTPRNNRVVVNQHKTKNEQIRQIDDIFADCEKDSLDGDMNGGHPDIPSPDYGSEEETELTTSIPCHEKGTLASTSDYIDEGLGESDSRSYYADDQGLEVILEEPEEDDYCSSHSSESDLRRHHPHRTAKGDQERSSLDGSEGIGSTEGDTGSSASEHDLQEDCGSSGIHSEDTPSPGPPQVLPTSGTLSKSPSEEEDCQKKEEERIQKDRCVEICHETLRQRKDRANNSMTPSPGKVDIKNWESNNTDLENATKKLLPSVKALRHQFENGKVSCVSKEESTLPPPPATTLVRSSNNSSTSSLTMSSLDTSSGFSSMASSQIGQDIIASSPPKDVDERVEAIYSQFEHINQQLIDRTTTTNWNAQPLLKKLYHVPDVPKMHSQGTTYVNIEGYLEKLPSGRKKATFWNAWKRRYFVAKDGVLYYYQNNQMEKPSLKLPLMGGKVEMMDPNMISVDDGDREAKSAGMLGIDDGKGHYVVVRCTSRQEAERWKKALDTHTVEDFTNHFVQPWPRPTNPTFLRDTLIIDLGSCSVRAGVLASQATLPQIFFPSVLATNRETKKQIWGFEALASDVRATSTITFPIRPSHKISKLSVDLTAVSSLLVKAFADLKVDPKNYNIQLSVPRVLNPLTQAELLKILFEKFSVKSVNITHQSILALYAYNATSGIVVDIGERIDVVPVIDGYIVDGGVSRIPYGGFRILEHLRQFLFQRNVSLVNEVESYVLRAVMEDICYCAHHYNTEKARCSNNPDNFEKPLSLNEYQLNEANCEAFQNISLDFGRFQATEGLFNPDAWGLDHPGLHKLVHKAIQECSMDIRKEMSRSIFLVGGVSQLPGLADRLSTELDNLTPTAIRPKVHTSPYRYHASYLGACVLAESTAFNQSKITKEEWLKQGNSVLRKWAL